MENKLKKGDVVCLKTKSIHFNDTPSLTILKINPDNTITCIPYVPNIGFQIIELPIDCVIPLNIHEIYDLLENEKKDK